MPANDAMDDVIVLVKKQIYIILLVNNIRKNILPVSQKLSLASLHTHHSSSFLISNRNGKPYRGVGV